MDNINEIRRLSAIMFTDIVGYSAVMNKNELAAMNLLKNHKEITKPIVDNYNGKILKPQGDGFMIEFSSVVDAVRCAMVIQKDISSYNTERNEDEKIRLRIGIHMGDLLIKDNDIYGNDVNIASRIEKLSDPGGICISQTVYDQIKNKVEIETLDLGETELKNITDKVNIYKVLLEAQEETGGIDTTLDQEEKKTSDHEDKNDKSNIKETIKDKVKKSIGGSIPNIDIKDKGDEVKIGPGGIKVKDKDGTKVEIGFDGIKVKEKDGNDVKIDLSGIKVKEKDGSKVKIDVGGIDIKDKTGKKRKFKKKKISKIGIAITNLISGIAFLVLIITLFADSYFSMRDGVIYFFAIAIIGSSIKTLFEFNFKKSIIKLLGLTAFLVFFIGLFTDLYDFWYGVIGAIAIGILISSLKPLLNIKDGGVSFKVKASFKDD